MRQTLNEHVEKLNKNILDKFDKSWEEIPGCNAGKSLQEALGLISGGT